MNNPQPTDTFTVKLTREQLDLLRDQIGEKYNHWATAWVPVGTFDKEKDLAYGILKAVDVVIGVEDYQNTYGDREMNPFAPTVVEFLKDRRYCDDEHLEQQGIIWKPEIAVA
jgi:hypothetical protein